MMVENTNLDMLAEAAERDSGDAKKAWRLLAAGIDATDLPLWVKSYVRQSADAVAAFDMQRGDQAQLAHNLGFYQEEPEPGIGSEDHIFDWVVDRMTLDVKEGRKINISRATREYHEEVMKLSGEPDSVRKVYEKARNRFQKEMRTGFGLLIE